MIDLLNNNQGVISVVAIAVSIIGFFITNWNIKIKINKKNIQKGKGNNIDQSYVDNSKITG